jgi:hypothetical protein
MTTTATFTGNQIVKSNTRTISSCHVNKPGTLVQFGF